METLSDLSAENIIELDNTLAWNFTVASDNATKLLEAIVIAAKYGMVIDPCEMAEIIGGNPEDLAEKFKYSARFIDVETLGHPTRLQAWEFAGDAEDSIGNVKVAHSQTGATGAHYVITLT